MSNIAIAVITTDENGTLKYDSHITVNGDTAVIPTRVPYLGEYTILAPKRIVATLATLGYIPVAGYRKTAVTVPGMYIMLVSPIAD